MFSPSLLQLEIEGIHKLVVKAIEESPEEIRETLYANIMLGGGNTCFPGFEIYLFFLYNRICRKT
jgi:actin-related protein